MTGFTRRISRLSVAAIHSAGRSRPIVVEFMPPGNVLGFRLQGCKRTYYLPIAHCFREAIRAETARAKAERRKEKAEKKKAR